MPDYNKDPIIQGHSFEQLFLAQQEYFLEVRARGPENAEENFIFHVDLAGNQYDTLLRGSLTTGRMYHLHRYHPAIDGVGVLKTDSTKYLVLLQVSLSPYRSHSSKHQDIVAKKVPSIEKSIISYYRELGEIPEDRVIYVYVSLNQLHEESSSLDIFASLTTTTRRGTVKRPYYCGLVKTRSAAAASMRRHCLRIGYNTKSPLPA